MNKDEGRIMTDEALDAYKAETKALLKDLRQIRWMAAVTAAMVWYLVLFT